jgi:phosphatidylglycerophosphatase A
MIDTITSIIATGFYTGMIPILPGVWGSAFALILWYFCKNFSLPLYVAVTTGIFLIGGFAAGAAEIKLAQTDASPIVIDEILGIFVTLIAAPKVRFSWLWGFLTFLILDGLKPFPASWIDASLKGGWGIMLDDVVVGIYALLALHLIRHSNQRKRSLPTQNITPPK